MIYWWNGTDTPFSEVARPAAERTVALLRKAFAEPALLCERAWSGLQAECVNVVAQAALSDLYVRFSAFRSTHGVRGSRQRWLVDAGDVTSAISRPTRDVVNRVLEDWSASASQMLQRLQNDVRSGLLPGVLITDIDGGLSEYHRGACVRRLKFEDGSALYYKPRDCSMELWWSRLAEWVTHEGISTLTATRTTALADYGYSHAVSVGALRDRAAVARYYRHAGHLLFWMWLTGTRDAVASNVVVSADCPVMVDVETAFYPVAEGAQSEPILETGFLPIPQPGGAGAAMCISGIGLQQGAFRSVRQAKEPATDSIALQRAIVPMSDVSFLPHLNGEAIGVDRYLRDLLHGFSDAYDAVAARRDALLREDGPLHHTRGLVGRLAVRPTAFYGELMHLSTLVAAGVSAASIEDLLTRARCGVVGDSQRRQLVALELAELERLSVPRFRYTVDYPRHIEPLGIVRGLESGDRAMWRRVNEFSAQDRDRQIAHVVNVINESVSPS